MPVTVKAKTSFPSPTDGPASNKPLPVVWKCTEWTSFYSKHRRHPWRLICQWLTCDCAAIGPDLTAFMLSFGTVRVCCQWSVCGGSESLSVPVGPSDVRRRLGGELWVVRASSLHPEQHGPDSQHLLGFVGPHGRQVHSRVLPVCFNAARLNIQSNMLTQISQLWNNRIW